MPWLQTHPACSPHIVLMRAPVHNLTGSHQVPGRPGLLLFLLSDLKGLDKSQKIETRTPSSSVNRKNVNARMTNV